MSPMVKVGVAFAASAWLTYLVGDAMLRRRDALWQDDSYLVERVRIRVAELVSHPEAIDVQVEGNLVRVSGRVLASELDRLLSQLTQVPRVHRVYNTLVSVDDPVALLAGSDGFGGGSQRSVPVP